MLNSMKSWSTKRKVIMGAIAFFIIIGIFGAIGSLFESEESKAAKAEATAIAVQATEAKDAEEQAKGFHCLSAWDGNHDGFEKAVKDNLNDPNSMETLSTKIAPVNTDGYHAIFMEFTAKNALGGRVRSTATGAIESATCEATLISIE